MSATASTSVAAKLSQIWQRGVIHSTTREKTTPDEWARRNRVYPLSSGRPGPRDPSYTPYMIEYARCFDRAYQVEWYGRQFDAVAMACGAQMAKTETVLDIAGWSFDQRPAPFLYVGPTKDFLHGEIEPRLMAMLLGTRSLRERLATGKALSKFRKTIGGVPLRLAWGGSASSLRGMAAKYALIDELDAMDDDVQGNGDPFSLLEARGFSFADRMRGAISTPLTGAVDVERDEASGLEFWRRMATEDVSSPIWRLIQSGTMHHWSWPCPHCEQYFIPRFKQLRIPENASPGLAKREAFVECPRCAGRIDEHHKADMNARGRYVAPGQSVDASGTVSGPLPDVTTLSFWASGLASPMITFGERAAAYVAAKISGKETEIQSVINTGFGECYAPGGGDVPEWEEVAALRRPYQKLHLPVGVRLLTLTADVQKRRIVYVIRGWGAKGSSWLIDAGELHGPTTESDVWNAFAELLHRPIGDMVIRRCFVDSGFRPGKPELVPVNKVYEFCRRFPRLVYPTKGRAKQDKPLMISQIEVNLKGSAKKYGLDLVLLDTDHFKGWVHERIRWEPDQPGAWLLPEDVGDDYCKQIVSEARVKKPNGAPVWVQRSRENHYFDCEAMQAAVGHMLNAHLLAGGANEAPAAPTDASSKLIRRVETVAPQTVEKQQPIATRLSAKSSRQDRKKRISDIRNRLYGAQ